MPNKIIVLLCFLPTLLLSACVTHDFTTAGKTAAPAVTAAGVRYIGSHLKSSSVDAFLGVPFAQAPLGELRWMPPKPMPAGIGTRTAQNFAPACMQGPHLQNWYKNVITSFGGDPETFPEPVVSEDCLYLNIWRPHSETDPNEPLPVHVFIHGGSNKGGWAYEPNYIGENMAGRGIIAVTIAYRLGAFGFFSHPQLEHANFALLDQIAALQWIQDNIASLGGDPTRVTVAGESAGASNIAYLMASPLASGLFQRVIHQSAGWAMRGVRNAGDNAELGKQLEQKVLSSGQGIDALRKAPAGEVLEASYQVYKGHFFDPVIDGHSVTLSVDEAAAQGKLTPVDLLIGSNANEALMYVDKTQTPDQWIMENVAQLDADKIKAALNPDDTPLQQLDQLSTAWSYTCPSLQLAAAMVSSGGRSWVYHFTKVREGELAAQMGAYHGAELPYIFDTHDGWLPTNELDHQLTASMTDYWRAFIYSGDPNTDSLPVWQGYAQRSEPAQTLSVNIHSAKHSSADLCAALTGKG